MYRPTKSTALASITIDMNTASIYSNDFLTNFRILMNFKSESYEVLNCDVVGLRQDVAVNNDDCDDDESAYSLPSGKSTRRCHTADCWLWTSGPVSYTHLTLPTNREV